jgi:hypothetical protein
MGVCIEATAQIGVELSRHVTLVGDATAARSRVALHAALGIDGPTYTHGFLTGRCWEQLSIGRIPLTQPAAPPTRQARLGDKAAWFLLRRTLRTSSYSVTMTYDT